MPWKPLTHCPTPGCPERTNGQHCTHHRRQQQRDLDHTRGTSRDRGYTHTWDQRRTTYLTNNPTCTRCGNPATIAHHRIRRTLLVAAGITDPDADRYLEPLCQPCHSTHHATTRDRFG